MNLNTNVLSNTPQCQTCKVKHQALRKLDFGRLSDCFVDDKNDHFRVDSLSETFATSHFEMYLSSLSTLASSCKRLQSRLCSKFAVRLACWGPDKNACWASAPDIVNILWMQQALSALVLLSFAVPDPAE